MSGGVVRAVRRSLEDRLAASETTLEATVYALCRLTREKREPFWLPVAVVSELTGLAPRTLRNRAAQGRIPSCGSGKARRVDLWTVYDGQGGGE